MAEILSAMSSLQNDSYGVVPGHWVLGGFDAVFGEQLRDIEAWELQSVAYDGSGIILDLCAILHGDGSRKSICRRLQLQRSFSDGVYLLPGLLSSGFEELEIRTRR